MKLEQYKSINDLQLWQLHSFYSGEMSKLNNIDNQSEIINLRRQILDKIEIEIPKYVPPRRDIDFITQLWNSFDEEKKHSFTSANFDRFVVTAMAVIGMIWEEVCQKLFGQSFQMPEFESFDGFDVSIHHQGRLHDINSLAFYFPGNNTIYLSRQSVFFHRIATSLNSGIGLTLLIAHEMAHALQEQLSRQGPYIFSASEAEDNADFFSGCTLKRLGGLGMLDGEDLDLALETFSNIGVRRKKGEIRVHGTSEERKINLMRGYDSDILGVYSEFDSYTPHGKLIRIISGLENTRNNSIH